MPCSTRVLMSFTRFESYFALACGAYGEWGVAGGLGEAEVRRIVACASTYLNETNMRSTASGNRPVLRYPDIWLDYRQPT